MSIDKVVSWAAEQFKLENLGKEDIHVNMAADLEPLKSALQK